MFVDIDFVKAEHLYRRQRLSTLYPKRERDPGHKTLGPPDSSRRRRLRMFSLNKTRPVVAGKDPRGKRTIRNKRKKLRRSYRPTV